LAALLDIDKDKLLLIITLPPSMVEDMMVGWGIDSDIADDLHDISWIQGIGGRCDIRSDEALSASDMVSVSTGHTSHMDVGKQFLKLIQGFSTTDFVWPNRINSSTFDSVSVSASPAFKSGILSGSSPAQTIF
jgi:hypothetical protein